MSNTYEQRYIFFFQLQIYGLQTENKAGRDSMALGKFTSLLDDSALEHSIQDLSVWRKSIVENHTFLWPKESVFDGTSAKDKTPQR